MKSENTSLIIDILQGAVPLGAAIAYVAWRLRKRKKTVKRTEDQINVLFKSGKMEKKPVGAFKCRTIDVPIQRGMDSIYDAYNRNVGEMEGVNDLANTLMLEMKILIDGEEKAYRCLIPDMNAKSLEFLLQKESEIWTYFYSNHYETGFLELDFMTEGMKEKAGLEVTSLNNHVVPIYRSENGRILKVELDF